MAGPEEKASNGRIEYLREDFQTLREEMQAGFEKMNEKLDDAKVARSEEKIHLSRECKANRNEIWESISDIEDDMQEVDTRLTILFWAGNGISFLLGAVVSAGAFVLFG